MDYFSRADSWASTKLSNCLDLLKEGQEASHIIPRSSSRALRLAFHLIITYYWDE